ncbi:hypothetical protein NL511_24890 [Klebsiella pneumoniae]|nr:hypothetical protein [Klebsiella pneumoniae]MCP6581629.1 hypothetical protein [Klebsiella pneumoniae]MCP6611539.1 hypothetical protein [Klebsiella pneumoniae]MCP6628556.1 hypothetical protein [Klebsiella pneumoniae]
MSNSVKETARDKMISDLTKYYFTRKGNKSYLTMLENNRYLFAKNDKDEGFYLVSSKDKDSIIDLTKSIYMEIIKEAKEHGLNNKYHIYATGCLFASPLIDFNKISNVEENF